MCVDRKEKNQPLSQRLSLIKLTHCLAVNLLQIDLVPPEIVTAWKQYFKSKFEHLKVVCFTSFPKDENERKKDPSKGNDLLVIVQK